MKVQMDCPGFFTLSGRMTKLNSTQMTELVLHIYFISKGLLSEHVIPKYPSLQTQMKVSTLTSTQVAPLSHGELSHATQGADEKVNYYFGEILLIHHKICNTSHNYC